MALKLIVEDDSGKRTSMPAAPNAQGELTLGRAADNSLRLDERNVSRHHAKIVAVSAELWRLTDMGSYNGVWVNGTRIDGAIDLSLGDIMRVGDFFIELRKMDEPGDNDTNPGRLIGDEGTEPEGDQRALARKIAEEVTTPGDAAPPSDPGQAAMAPLGEEPTAVTAKHDGPTLAVALDPPYAHLLCLVGPKAGSAFAIDRSEMVIGRTQDNDIAIDHRSMSRHHAKVTVADGRYRICDLDSANGLFIGDETYRDSDLKQGDVLELGHVRLRFVAPGEPAALDADEQAQLAPRPKPKPKRRALAAPLVGLAAVALAIAASYGYLRRPPVPTANGATPSGARPPPGAIDSAEAEKLIGQAREAAAARQCPKAEALASAALALDGSRAEAHTIITQCDLEQKGRAALEAATQAAGRNDWTASINALRDVPRASSSAKGAASLFDQVRPQLVREHVEAARRALNTDHLDEAVAQAGEVALLEPNNTVLAELHQAIDEARKRALAATETKAAQDHNSSSHGQSSGHKEGARPSRASIIDDPRALYAEATRALGDGKYPRALEILGRCIAADKTYARCYRALGIAYAKVGNGPKAAKNYRLYLKADPQAKDGSTVRELLQQYEASQGRPAQSPPP